MTIWRMCTAHWVLKATKHTDLLFRGQQFLRERASMLLYTYNDCLWCGLAAPGELQQVDTAKILTPVMAQQEE